MRKILISFFLLFFSVLCAYSLPASRMEYFANMIGLSIDTATEIPERNLSIIHYIISNVQEHHIHCMRGEASNWVFISTEGRVFVYDSKNKIVTNYNRGGFNIVKKDKPFDHFILDTLPWLNFGVDPEDPTSIEERFYAYLTDVQDAIFSFLFHGNAKLKEIKYSELSQSEKEVCNLFNQMLFNDNFEIKLTDENIRKMKRSANLWSKYCHQIFDLFF